MHTAYADEPCTGACKLTVPLPNATLANDLLKMDFSWRYSSTAPTVSNIYCNSDAGQATWTWSLAKSVLNTGDSTDTFSYYVAGAPAGCTSVTIVASAVWTNAGASFKEYREVAPSSPVDATGGGIDSGTSPSFAATVTTTAANDLIDQFCTVAPIAGSTLSTDLATASLGFTALDIGGRDEYGSIAEIDSSTGSLTGTEDYLGQLIGGDGNCTIVAFKTSAGAGTIPIGVHIVQQTDRETNSTASTQFQAHLFNPGDALVIMGVMGVTAGNNQWNSISDSLSNSLTSYVTGDSNGWYPEWVIDCDAVNTGNDLISFSSASNGDGNWVVMEIAGLKNSSHTACYETSAKAAGNNGSGGHYTGPTITPANSTDLVLASINEGVGPITGISSPSGAAYNYPTYTGQTDASDLTEGGGYSILYKAGTSALTWEWASPNSTTWGTSAIALEAGSSQSTAPAAPTGLQAVVH